MDSSNSWNMRSYLTAVFYLVALTVGVLSKSQQPLDIHHLPKFLPTNNNYTFRVGQVAVLECAIENLSNKKVIWRLASDSTPLTVGYMSFNEDPRYAVEHDRDGTKWNLVIRDVQFKDAGVYECQVSSKMRHLRHHVTLMVTDAKSSTPKPNIQISGSNYVDEGDRIYLVCNATSEEYPPEDIDWFRGGNTLTTNASHQLYIQKFVSISTGTIFSILEIKHAQLSDQGVYVCRTSNKDVTSIHVNVLNGDTYNVKRGTLKKDGKATSKSAITDDDHNSTNSPKLAMTPFLVAMTASFHLWRFIRIPGLT